MKKCGCGHTHCCHKKVKREIVHDTNEFGFSFVFMRRTCASPNCRQWLGDSAITKNR